MKDDFFPRAQVCSGHQLTVSLASSKFNSKICIVVEHFELRGKAILEEQRKKDLRYVALHRSDVPAPRHSNADVTMAEVASRPIQRTMSPPRDTKTTTGQ